MNATVKSITLTYDEVARILEEHVNAHLLRTPHHVVDVDPWPWDVDAKAFTLALEPAVGVSGLPAERPVAVALAHASVAVTEAYTAASVASTNGTNGKTAHPEPTQEAAVRQQNGRKRGESKYSAAQRAEVIRLRHVEHKTILDIVSATGIPESSIYGILADHRKHGSAGITDAQRSEIYRLYESGASPEAIVQQLGITESVYCDIIEPAIRNKLVRQPAERKLA